jgi:hypothetical protein
MGKILRQAIYCRHRRSRVAVQRAYPSQEDCVAFCGKAPTRNIIKLFVAEDDSDIAEADDTNNNPLYISSSSPNNVSSTETQGATYSDPTFLTSADRQDARGGAQTGRA